MRHSLGKAHDLILRDHRELRHPAPGVRQPDAAHRRAQVLQPAPTVRALAAVGERHDRDAIPFPRAGHAGPGRHDVSRELVPKDLRVLRSGQRMRLDRRDDRAGHVLVQIGAADATRDDSDDDLPDAGCGRLGHLLDPEITRGVEAKRPQPPTPASSWNDPLGP